MSRLWLVRMLISILFEPSMKGRKEEHMDPEDFLEPEVAVTAAVTAAIFSPTIRRWIRRGLVYATAGVLIAGDALTSAARTAGQGVQQAGAAAANAAHNVATQAKEAATSAPGPTSDSAQPSVQGTGEQFS
jgi:hypothetical protein